MKLRKGTICAVTTTLLLTLTGTGSAKHNPYADVPEGNWSYQAVEQLAEHGLVRGIKASSLKGQVLSRSEMAVITAKAMSKENGAPAEDKEIIKKLEAEYAHELNYIGVDDREDEVKPAAQADQTAPAAVEKPKEERFTYSGTGRIRFDNGDTKGPTMSRGKKQGHYTSNSHINIDLFYNYKINDQWNLKGESEYGRQMNFGAENQTLQHSVFEQMYLEGPLADNVMIKAGRFSAYSPMGLIYDDKVTGGQLTFGKVLKTTLEAGKATSTDDDDTINYHAQNYQSVNFDLPLSKVVKAHAGYYHIGGNVNQNQVADDYVSYYDLGFDVQLSRDLKLNAVYAKSNADGIKDSALGITSDDTNSYLVRLQYGNVDYKKPKTWDAFVMYRHSPQLGAYSNTDDWCRNVSGIRLGGDYVVTKNMGLSLWYTFGKDIDTNERSTAYRLQWNFML